MPPFTYDFVEGPLSTTDKKFKVSTSIYETSVEDEINKWHGKGYALDRAIATGTSHNYFLLIFQKIETEK